MSGESRSAPSPESVDADLSREHLANERTFLAWTRTAIAMMGFGVVIARLGLQTAPGEAPSRLVDAQDLGMLFAGSGVVVVVLSIWRYASVRRSIRERRYESSLYGPVMFGVAVVLLGLVSLLYLFERLPGVP